MVLNVDVSTYSEGLYVNVYVLELQLRHVPQKPIKLGGSRTELQGHGHVNGIVRLLQAFEYFLQVGIVSNQFQLLQSFETCKIPIQILKVIIDIDLLNVLNELAQAGNNHHRIAVI